VRLFRLVKLYKHVRTTAATQQATRRASQATMSTQSESVDLTQAVQSATPMRREPRKSTVTLQLDGMATSRRGSTGEPGKRGSVVGNDEPELNVGRALSDLTIRRVILLVLVMLLVLPLFDASTFKARDSPHAQGFQQVHQFLKFDGPAIVRSTALDQYFSVSGTLLHVDMYGLDSTQDKELARGQPCFDAGEYAETLNDINDRFRPDEVELATADGCYHANATVDEAAVGPCVSMVVWMRRDEIRLEAGLNIARTLFVMVVLCVGAILFTRDAEEMIIKPIGRMVAMVQQLSNHPLDALDLQGKDSSMLDSAVLCCAVLCCAVLCCAVLCCAVLCCAVLCCAVLCCAVLCCADELSWARARVFSTPSSHQRQSSGALATRLCCWSAHCSASQVYFRSASARPARTSSHTT
jgi:hypothetical protein